eukprot:SAG22_NODE_602_length_8663_cov_17.617936_5_plen_320_part_00
MVYAGDLQRDAHNLLTVGSDDLSIPPADARLTSRLFMRYDWIQIDAFSTAGVARSRSAQQQCTSVQPARGGASNAAGPLPVPSDLVRLGCRQSSATGPILRRICQCAVRAADEGRARAGDSQRRQAGLGALLRSARGGGWAKRPMSGQQAAAGRAEAATGATRPTPFPAGFLLQLDEDARLDVCTAADQRARARLELCAVGAGHMHISAGKKHARLRCGRTRHRAGRWDILKVCAWQCGGAGSTYVPSTAASWRCRPAARTMPSGPPRARGCCCGRTALVHGSHPAAAPFANGLAITMAISRHPAAGSRQQSLWCTSSQ